MDYKGSGYDRGHLIASANQREQEIQNSETFLLSNMAPQKPDLNRKIWRELEEAIRKLDSKKNVLRTFVICGPIFNFDVPIKTIGSSDDNGVSIPIPHSFFKSILTEDNKGSLKMWSFMIPNAKTTKKFKDFQVSTTKVEQYAGIELWDGLRSVKTDREKSRVRKIWS